MKKGCVLYDQQAFEMQRFGGISNYFHAGLGVTQSLLDQNLGGDVVQHITMLVDHPILAMAGVRVQRAIGNHPNCGNSRLSVRTTVGTKTLRIARLHAIQRLARLDHRKQSQRWNPQLDCLFRRGQQAIQTLPHHPRHRHHRSSRRSPSSTNTG